jgi:hypothetical protein
LAKHQKLDLLIERLELVTKRLENVASFAAISQGKDFFKFKQDLFQKLVFTLS